MRKFVISECVLKKMQVTFFYYTRNSKVSLYYKALFQAACLSLKKDGKDVMMKSSTISARVPRKTTVCFYCSPPLKRNTKCNVDSFWML